VLLAGAPPLYRRFGAIHWLDQVTLANPFAGKAEASMVEHMNSDHANAIAHYVALTGLPPARRQMVGIDSEGMHLRIGQAVYWLAFPKLATRRHKSAKPWFGSRRTVADGGASRVETRSAGIHLRSYWKVSSVEEP
jgi:hypothetical protein